MIVDLVVVNYRTSGDLERFVKSLVRDVPTTPCRLGVINVDPERQDRRYAEALVQVAARWSIPSHTVGIAENIGYGAACNHAAALGSGDIIAFFNADVELTKGAIDECASVLMDNEKWGILGPRQVDDQNRFTAAGIVGTRESPQHRGWMQLDQGQYSDVVTSCPTISGSAMFVKRSVFRELSDCPDWKAATQQIWGGAFLESHYYSETALCYHAIEHGYENAYWGETVVKHLWHRASEVGGRVEQEMPREQERFRSVCDAMHGGIPHD